MVVLIRLKLEADLKKSSFPPRQTPATFAINSRSDRTPSGHFRIMFLDKQLLLNV